MSPYWHQAVASLATHNDTSPALEPKREFSPGPSKLLRCLLSFPFLLGGISMRDANKLAEIERVAYLIVLTKLLMLLSNL
jgi:hypothetical protein